jgi:purine-binding chemotaxis protein CheW
LETEQDVDLVMRNSSGLTQCVVFRVERREYALPLQHVLHVLQMVAITPVPEGPAWLLGVVNWHGRVLPVMDLRARLGLPTQPAGLDTPLILFQAENGTAALVADAMVDVLTVPLASVDPPDARLGTAHAVSATVRWGERLILLLDPARLWTGAGSLALTEI